MSAHVIARPPTLDHDHHQKHNEYFFAVIIVVPFLTSITALAHKTSISVARGVACFGVILSWLWHRSKWQKLFKAVRKGSTTLNRTEEEMAAAFSLRLHAAASDAADVKQQRRVHESSDIYWWMVWNEQCNILEDTFLFSCHSLFVW